MTITILGRQPAISLAELESLYGSQNVHAVGDIAATIDSEIDFARIGGSLKAAEFFTSLDTTNPQKVFDYCRKALPEFIADFPEGKIKLGVSMYGLSMPLAKQNANTLSLKKVIRDIGRSVRVVPNTEAALSSAQTYHNQLTSAVGCELLMIRDGDKTLIGRVTHVQNINEYTERDRERPKRDTKVGMLPPKLAQTIINLAVGSRQPGRLASSSEEAKKRGEQPETTASSLRGSNSEEARFQTGSDLPTLLDPFCGTGVILQEAALMGYGVYGSDIEPRMIDYSRKNLEWLTSKYPLPNLNPQLESADATDHIWRQPIYTVACEGYLGTPFASEPPDTPLKDTIMTCNLITKKFLRNIHGQLAPNTRLCIAVPAWYVRGRIHHLPFLDDIAAVGYTRVEFKHAAASDLTYHRDDQVVGRELLVLSVA